MLAFVARRPASILLTVVLLSEASALVAASKPTMVYGTAWKKGRTKELVKAALQQGFRALDTANMPKHYNETLVGAALREALADPTLGLKREDLWIQTKFTPDACKDQPPELHPFDAMAEFATQVRASFDGSLAHLGVSYLDSYLLHAPLRRREDTLAVWREMEKLREEGLAKDIGVSNFNREELDWLLHQATIRPAFVQNRCLHKDGWDRYVRELCAAMGLGYQGFWLLTGNRAFVGSQEVTDIAKQRRVSPQVVVYAFATQKLKMMALSGTTNTSHMAEDLVVASGGLRLSRTEVQRLEAVSSPRFGSTDRVQVTLENHFEERVTLFWENGDSGQLVENAKLEPGGSQQLNTFHSHSFAAKLGDDRLVYRWRADREEGEAQTIRVEPAFTVVFRNVGGTKLEVFWRDFDDQEVPHGYVEERGGELELGTHIGHNFVIREAEAGKFLGTWVAEYASRDRRRVVLGEEGRANDQEL